MHTHVCISYAYQMCNEDYIYTYRCYIYMKYMQIFNI